MTTAPFMAGAARICITPPLGTRINGDFVTHYARFVHDELYAKALVLQSGGERLVFLVLDTCIIPNDFAAKVKAALVEKYGGQSAGILIASTHTHAAGSLSEVHLSGIDYAYSLRVPELLIDVVGQAIARLRPAQVAFGTVDAPEHLVCRRYLMDADYVSLNPVTGAREPVKTNPIGGEKHILERVSGPDPQLSFMGIKGTDGKWISLLANYSLHYVGDWEDGTISADYYGVFSAHLAALLGAGDDFVGIMSNGTSGDVNIWDFLAPDRYPAGFFNKSRLIGEELAAKVAGAAGTLAWLSDAPLQSRAEEVSLKVKKPDAAGLEKAIALVAASRYEEIVPDADGIRAIYAREQVLLHAFPETIHCPVQVLRIGHHYIGALAGEFFAETGLALKAQFVPGTYFTISMANGNIGYVPPEKEFANGGYETWRCRYSCAEENAEEKVRKRLLELAASFQDA